MSVIIAALGATQVVEPSQAKAFAVFTRRNEDADWQENAAITQGQFTLWAA